MTCDPPPSHQTSSPFTEEKAEIVTCIPSRSDVPLCCSQRRDVGDGDLSLFTLLLDFTPFTEVVPETMTCPPSPYFPFIASSQSTNACTLVVRHVSVRSLRWGILVRTLPCSKIHHVPLFPLVMPSNHQETLLHLVLSLMQHSLCTPSFNGEIP